MARSTLPEVAVASCEEALRRDPSNAVASRNLALLSQAARPQDPVEQTQPAPADSTAPAFDAPPDDRRRPGGRLTLTGWTSGPKERRLLDRILAGQEEILDLTSDDSGDPDRMIRTSS